MKILVTGATGFIGRHLIRHLDASGYAVRAMVRPTSNIEGFPAGVEYAHATLEDLDALRRAVSGVQVVIHLACLLKVPWKPEFQTVNVDGTRRVLEACAEQDAPPVFVFISSLAAAGPAESQGERREDEVAAPVSIYGRAKLAAETIVDAYAHQMPCSIIRPPMVYGPGDEASLPLFQSTARGLHVVPRWSSMRLSTIFVHDLCTAIERVAVSGKRRPGYEASKTSDGLYFVAADEVTTYAELGKRAGRAAGQTRVRVLRIPSWISFIGATFSEIWARVRDQSQILNRDKWREATAGDWVCSTARIRNELGWAPEADLDTRLATTARAYADAGVLRLGEDRGAEARKTDDRN